MTQFREGSVNGSSTRTVKRAMLTVDDFVRFFLRQNDNRTKQVDNILK